MAEVFFAVDSRDRIAADYDRDLLHLGAIVHVLRSETGTRFSPAPIEGAERYAVTWISPSAWYVPLSKELGVKQSDVERVLKVTGELASEDVVRGAFVRCSELLPIEKLYLTSAIEQNPIDQIMAVVERMELVTRIGAPDLGKGLWDQYEPLVVYLMLTCFDRLGQPSEWLSFSSWLDQPSTKLVRTNGTNVPVEQARLLYRSWSEKYGVRNSFYRFMDHVLPKPALRDLLSSIEITRLNNPPEIGEPLAVSEEDKQAWLYDTRNRFTHSLKTLKGLHSEHFVSQLPGWHVKGQRFEKTIWSSFSVTNWPEAIIEAVRQGLAATLQSLSQENQKSAD